MSAERSTLRIHPNDTLVVALRDLPAGTSTAEGPTLRQPIHAKHKFALRDLAKGELVVMYGVVVGRCTEAIAAGSLVGTHNLRHEASACHGKSQNLVWNPPDVGHLRARRFQGYRRIGGGVGTANHWIVLPLVFCENRNLSVMREALQRALGYSRGDHYEAYTRALLARHLAGDVATDLDPEQWQQAAHRPFAHVDGIEFLEHGLGCGGTRQDAQALVQLLAGYIAHPNVAGATVLSLGCQHAQVSMLQEALAQFHPKAEKPVLIFEQQKSSSERDLIGRAIAATLRGVAQANDWRREPCALSDLVLGLECGGSDGFSGISANPVLGQVSDLLSALGGAPVLAEFPELCGVEQYLCDRCVSEELAQRFLGLMKSYEATARACGSGFDANPSPGNIRDGLITDAIKSAGAALKGGTAPIVGVLDYTEPVQERGGLTLCCTPGNDVESTTAIVAAGCNLVLFTTGLGTPTGNPVCPTLKISTNSELMQRMGDILDFDTGPVITGEQTVPQMGESLLDLCIATASGEYVPKAVSLGQDDFLPWKRGVSL